MNRVTRSLAAAFLTLVVVGVARIAGACFYYDGEVEPVIPPDLGVPDTVTINQALQDLAAAIADRLADPPAPLDVQLGGPIRSSAFASLSGAENLAALGRDPVGTFNAAADGFEKVLQKNPKDLGAHRGLVRARAGLCGWESLQGKGDNERCILHAKVSALEALKVAPDDPALLHLLANIETTLATQPNKSVAERAKHYTDAERLYNRAAAAGYVFSKYSLGLLYLSMNSYRKAQKYLREFQTGFGEAVPGLDQALADLDKAIAGEPSRDLDDAFEKLMKDGDTAGAGRLFESGLGRMHQFLGVPADQEQKSAPAHDQFRHASAHYNLASILAQQGKVDEAFRHLKQALMLGWTKGQGAGDRRGRGLLRRQLDTDPDLAPLRNGNPERWQQEILSLAG